MAVETFHMADIRGKRPTRRRAVAVGELHAGAEAFAAIVERRLPKGDAMVMAEIAGDKVMTAAYRKGLDLHAVTAAGMLGIAQEEFDPGNPAHKEARQKAKAVNFGVIYGSGANGLREFARDAYNLQMTLEEAAQLIDARAAAGPAKKKGRAPAKKPAAKKTPAKKAPAKKKA